MKNTPCQFYKNGNCTKWLADRKCEPSNNCWFTDGFDQCDINAVCAKSSIYGNDYFYLTDRDIEALKAGKILYFTDEYGMFIAYKKENPDLKG